MGVILGKVGRREGKGGKEVRGGGKGGKGGKVGRGGNMGVLCKYELISNGTRRHTGGKQLA